MKIFPIIISILSLTISTTSSTSSSLTATNSEISAAISTINSHSYSSESVDDIEDNLKNNIVNYYDNHSGYVTQIDLTLLKNYLSNNDYSYVSPASNLSLVSVSTRLNLEYLSNDTFSTSSIINSCLPSINYNSSNATLTYVPSINDKVFIGIYLSKDAAIGIYNFLANVINNYDTTMNLIDSILNLAGSSIETFVSALSPKIITYIATFLASIPTGTIGTLIKIALTIVTVSVIIFLITAFFFGMIEKGFYIGFIRNTAFDWRFICGTED